jgi:hypothetical protein
MVGIVSLYLLSLKCVSRCCRQVIVIGDASANTGREVEEKRRESMGRTNWSDTIFAQATSQLQI